MKVKELQGVLKGSITRRKGQELDIVFRLGAEGSLLDAEAIRQHPETGTLEVILREV